jgi:hypothetical protein
MAFNWNVNKFDDAGFLQAMEILYRNSITTLQNGIDIDPRFLNPEWWKVDKFGNLSNTWCRLLTEEEVAKTYDNIIQQGVDTISERVKARTDEIGVLLFGVSIQLSKSPNIITTTINGFNSPVYTKFSNTGFDINITALESTNFYWQQNSNKLRKLVEILDNNQSLYIANPQLNLTYEINKVVIKDYAIGQDNRFYSHTPISISCSSDDKRDIIKPVIKKA